MATSPRRGKGPAPAATPLRPYKYGDQFRGIAGCPFGADEPAESAFRIVHSDLRHADNFTPNALLYPGNYANRNGRCQCKSWALSVFEKKEQLSARVLKMEKTIRKWREIVGDHGVRLNLLPQHGRRTEADSEGHFSFFEFVGFDAKTVATDHFALFP